MKPVFLLCLVVWALSPSAAQEAHGRFVRIAEDPVPVDSKIEANVEDLLSETILIDLDLVEMEFRDALDAIQSTAERVYSAKLPPERQGLSFSVVSPPLNKVTLRGKRVSYGLALDELCRRSGMLWTNAGYVIKLKPGTRFTQRKSPFPGKLEN